MSYRGSKRGSVRSQTVTARRPTYREEVESADSEEGCRPPRIAIVGTLRQANIHNSQAVVEYLMRQELRPSESRLALRRMNDIFKQAVLDFEDIIAEQHDQVRELELRLARAESELANQAVPLLEDDDFAPSIRHKAASSQPRERERAQTQDPMIALARALGQAPVQGLPMSLPGTCPPMLGSYVGQSTFPYPIARVLDEREKPKQNMTFIIHYNESVTPEAALGRLREEQEALSRYAVGRDIQRGETVVAVSYRRRKSTIGAKTFQVGGRVPVVTLPARKMGAQAFEYVEKLPGAIKWGEAQDVSDAELRE